MTHDEKRDGKSQRGKMDETIPLFLRVKLEKENPQDKEDLKREILRIKREKDTLILSHNYMIPEIQEIADFVGDSLELSIKSAESPNQVVLMCGVHFMAEGVKLISPNKTVLLPRLEAGCFMSDMINLRALRKLKEEFPGVPIICYINSDATVKAESDICCTSSNAVQITKTIDSDSVIFIPDRNLGLYVQRFTSQRIVTWNGWCNVHHRFRAEDIMSIRAEHPDAVVIAHPECLPEVIDLADEVLSTSGMIRFAKETKSRKLAFATEIGLIERVRREVPDKIVLSCGRPQTCVNMKSIRLSDVLEALREEKHKIEVPQAIFERARTPIIRMLEVSRGKEFVKKILDRQGG